MVAVEHFLYQLKARATADLDVLFQISLLEISYLMRMGSHFEALKAIEQLAAQQTEEDADIYQKTYLLILKAQLFARCGNPEKGFSIAMRAASTSHRTRLLPLLWEAVGTLANILIYVKEFDAARKLLDSVIPQVCRSMLWNALG
jgi:anaphase-promoting complex subunit 5